MENRLTELEIKMTYQDQIIEDLNQLVIEQKKQIDDLTKLYKKMSHQIAPNEDDPEIIASHLETPPPHY